MRRCTVWDYTYWLHGNRQQRPLPKRRGAKIRREKAIMARISVDDGFCKGCGLCVDACPVGIIELDHDVITAKGYHPARCVDEERCTGCCSCATMCPDVAITVMR